MGIYCHPVPQLFSQFPDKTSFRISHYHFLQCHAQRTHTGRTYTQQYVKEYLHKSIWFSFILVYHHLLFLRIGPMQKTKEPCSILELNLLIKSAILIHTNLRACLDVSKLAIYLAERMVVHSILLSILDSAQNEYQDLVECCSARPSPSQY